MVPKKEDTTAEDTKKRKAEEAAIQKDAKKEKKEEVDDGEKEKDSPNDKRPVLKDTINWNAADVTLNVVPMAAGKVLMALSEGGMQYLIAGARANVGMQAGRYYYETKIIEALNPAESLGQRGRVPVPRQLVRLGVSVANSALVMGDAEDCVYFDSEGFYVSGKTKKASVSQRFSRDQVMGLLLNLDPQSPNFNTLSLFRDGERISEPQPLPEHLHGQPLFPHVCFRNVTLQVSFGPLSSKPLPFKCRMLQGAAKADVTSRIAVEPQDGKYDVMFPVACPDVGTFDWLDIFLQDNPQYVELSDRKILDWAARSGLWKPKGGGWKTSNDKPEFNFGLTGMDDFSIQRVLSTVAPVVPRHYIVMEVKANLVSEERKEALSRFNAPHFKKVAQVVMGEPSDYYKGKQLDRLLRDKQEKADTEWKAKKAEEERKKQVEMRQKQLQEMRKKADEQRKKAAEDAKRRREEEERKKAEEKAGIKSEGDSAGQEVKDEEGKPEGDVAVNEQTKDEAKEEEAKEEPKEETKDETMEEAVAEEAGPPQVELTEEEKKMWFRPVAAGSTGDIAGQVLSQSFGSFTMPNMSEGFDEVRYEWQGAEESAKFLKQWVLERKLTSRIEELQPGQWFQDKLAEWLRTFTEWQGRQRDHKNSSAMKRTTEDSKPEVGDLDIFSVEDVCDVGGGEPLFANFTFEDWALVQLRFDLYFLQLAYRRDVNDPERIGIHDSHIAFYYTKYFRKQLNPKYFGVSTNTELCKLVKDTVTIKDDMQVLTSVLAEDTETFDIFVKLTEEGRRERQRRIDAGDETAKLKFSPMAIQQPGPLKPATVPVTVPPSGVPRPASVWPQARPVAQQWTAAGRGATVFPQTSVAAGAAFRPQIQAGQRWTAPPAQAPTLYNVRPPNLAQQKWRS